MFQSLKGKARETLLAEVNTDKFNSESGVKCVLRLIG